MVTALFAARDMLKSVLFIEVRYSILVVGIQNNKPTPGLIVNGKGVLYHIERCCTHAAALEVIPDCKSWNPYRRGAIRITYDFQCFAAE